MEHGTPITFPEDESFDIGSDTRSGVAMLQYRYECPFKFTGTIDKLTFKLEPEQAAVAESKAELGPTIAPEPDPIDTSKRYQLPDFWNRTRARKDWKQRR